MAEEPQSRSETDISKRKLDEIQIAKQKAQEIVARLVNDAEAKRPRLDDASVSPVLDPDSDSYRPPLDFLQKPLNQPMTNSPFGLTPHVAQPAPYYNFQSTTKKMDIPNGKVGVVIGRGGETIKYLQLQSGARIQVTRDADADPYSQTREVELIGTSEQISRAEQLIKDAIAESDAGGSGTSSSRGLTSMQHGPEQFSMKVPNNKVSMIIGKGGETIKNMQSRSAARIQVIPLHLPPGDTSMERTVYINGTKEQIELAKELVNEVISENRVRNPLTTANYMQQAYPPPANWGPPGTHPVQGGPTPTPYYSFPPQSAGWDQPISSASAPPPQQSAAYNYYGQQDQTGSAPANANYGYDQGYSHQQPTHGLEGPVQGQQDPHNPYISSGYGPSSAAPAKPDGTTSQHYGTQTTTSQPFGTQSSTPLPSVQSVGTSTSQHYATQSSNPIPPVQPGAYGQQPAVPSAGYMHSQNYSGPLPSQPANAQMGFNHVGYSGQQPFQIPPSTSQTGYAQGGYPSYVQGTNPPTYGVSQPQPTTHLYSQSPAYGSETNRDGNVTAGSYGSAPATQEAVDSQS